AFCSSSRPPPRDPLFPYTTLFRSDTQRPIAERCKPVHQRGLLQVANAIYAQGDEVTAEGHLASGFGMGGIGIVEHRRGESRSDRSEEHASELQSRGHLVCRLLLEK